MRLVRLVLIAGALLVALPSHAQEALNIILERGYVAHWVVCGPFPSALEGGILDAVRVGASAVGGRDFMEGDGGIARIRPKHRQPIKVPGHPDAVWQRAGTEGPQLDLAPFYPSEPEGLSYAGFYTEAAAPTSVLMELHTPLGAQVWLNGTRVVVSQESALPLAGVDRALLNFRQGSNFLVIQTPGARLDALAEAARVSPRELSSQVFANRTLLSGKSGFEIALTLKPVSALGELVYTPTLQSTGSFSGTLGEVRQDETLALFNPTAERSSVVEVLVKSPQLLAPMLVEVPGVPPGERADALLSLPTGSVAPGSAVPVSITLTHEGQSATFDTSFNVLPRSDGGEVLLLTGTRHLPRSKETPEAQVMRLGEELSAQLNFADGETAYGFEAGTTVTWQAWLASHPEAWERWDALLATGRGGVSAQYSIIDERVASPELLVRNIGLGIASSVGTMDAPGIYDAWRARGLSPQTPQLLAQFGVPGIVSSLPVPGMEAIAWQAGLHGAPLPHRHVVPSEGAVTVEGLRNDAGMRRRELSDLGLDRSLLLLENALSPPEPFLSGATLELAGSFPSIKFSGVAGQRFFERVTQRADNTLPGMSHSMQRAHPGDLLSNPELMIAYRTVAERIGPVEALATLAAVEGYRFPTARLEQVWRGLAWYGQPAYLAARAGSETAWQALAALRAQWDTLQEIESRALAHLAAQVAVPESTLPEGVEPIAPYLVFAPGGAASTRVCEVQVPVPAGKEVVAFDRAGTALPVRMGGPVAQTMPSTRQGTLRSVSFVASVPPWSTEVVWLGLRTAKTQEPSTELLIQNSDWLAQFSPDTGELVQLLDKKRGLDYAKGALDAVAALGLSPDKLGDGRELWTSGEALELSGPPTNIQTFKQPGIEEVRLVSPMGEATLERRIRLVEGLPYVEVEGRIRGLRGAPRLIVSTASTPMPGRAPVFGERFGAVSGRIGVTPLEFRSEGMNRPSADGLYPAYRWAALSPSAELRFGLSRALPLVAAAIVHGEKPELAVSAETLRAALAHVGIPATVHAGDAGKGDALWTDGTPLPDALAALEPHAGMLFVVGAPEELPLLKRVLESLPDTARQRVGKSMERGGIFAARLRDGAPGNAMVPVVLMAGREAPALDALMEAFAESLRTLGYHTLPDEALLDEDVAAPRAEQGLAVLFPGTQPASVEADGRLLLAHGIQQSGNDEDFTFRYALYPLDGGWRSADVAVMAEHFASPAMTMETASHTGAIAPGTPLLAVSPKGLQVTAVKPAGNEGRVADGVVVRGYVESLAAWQGSIALRGPVSSAAQSSVTEVPGASLALAGGAASTGGASGEILSTWMLPRNIGRVASMSQDAVAMPQSPRYAAYPETGQMVAPESGFRCGLRVQVSWDREAPSARVWVANFHRDAVLEGTLVASATDGWSLGPEKQAVRLLPGKAVELELLLASVRARPGTGAVMVELETSEGKWFHVAREGAEWLDIKQQVERGRVVVDVTNRMGVRALGSAAIVAPAAWWPGWAGPAPGDTAHPAVHPREISFDLPPQGKQQLVFLVSAAQDAEVEGMLHVVANGQSELVDIGAPAR